MIEAGAVDQSQSQNKEQGLAVCGHMSASSQSLRFILSLSMNSSFITSRPGHSPYSSNIVLARKKDCSLRFCVDFRKLNNKTVKDACAIPRIEESLHLL